MSYLKIQQPLSHTSDQATKTINAFKKLFSDMNDQLSETPWLSGKDYSIADISLVVYLITSVVSFKLGSGGKM